MENNFDAALAQFIADSQAKINEHYAKNFPNLKPSILELAPGRKYVKIVCRRQNGDATSSWAFIDKTNGDILKAASWNAPAKHARGNIYQPETWATVTVYGPQYLR